MMNSEDRRMFSSAVPKVPFFVIFLVFCLLFPCSGRDLIVRFVVFDSRVAMSCFLLGDLKKRRLSVIPWGYWPNAAHDATAPTAWIRRLLLGFG